MKTGKVLTLRSLKQELKTRLKCKGILQNNGPNYIARRPHRFAELSPRIRNPINLSLWNYAPGLEPEPFQELDTREQAS